MNAIPVDHPAGGSARASLREAQLQLVRATDQLILDHSNTLARTLQFIVDQTERILNALHVDVFIAYPDGLREEISSDPEEVGHFVPLDNSISGRVLLEDPAILVNDLQGDPVFREMYYPHAVDAADGPPRISVLAARLTLGRQAIGVINVEATPHSFDASHLDFINEVAHNISVAITHATLFDEDSLRIATDNLLMTGTTPDSMSADNEEIMRKVLDAIMERLYSLAFLGEKVEAAEILFADPLDARSLIVVHSKNDADIGIKVGIDSSVCGAAFRENRTVLLQRAALESSDYRPIIEGMRCELAVPITLGGSQQFPIGVLNLESSQENAFSNVGRVLAERFARQVVNAVAMTKLRADIDNEQADQLQILAADQVLNAVHRINNHVGGVRGIVQELREVLDAPGPVDLGELRRGLLQIEDAANKALEIPNELMRRVAAPIQSADVNAQVEAGIQRVRRPRTVELVADLAHGLPDIPCTGLDLVIENLLTNAVKAQSTSIRVSTLVDRRLPREPVVVIMIGDNGTGMSSEQVTRLFEQKQAPRLFEQKQATLRGSGLGYSMFWTRNWVRRSRGLIDVDSHPGRGTTVSIRFQFDPQKLPKLAPKGASDRDSTNAGPHRGG
jgi:signal transduction histidine kinase